MAIAAATFGKFNIPHLGHAKLLSLMIAVPSSELIIGFSAGKANRLFQKRLESFYEFNPYLPNFSSCLARNLFDFVAMLNESYDKAYLCLGSDRIKTTQKMLYSCKFENIELIEEPRHAGAISSTMLRQIYKEHDGDMEGFIQSALQKKSAESVSCAIVQYNAILDELCQ